MSSDRVADTVESALAEVAAQLREAGVEAPRREARLLLAHALGTEAVGIISAPDRELTAAERERLSNVAARRARRAPLSHILGRREFWSLPFRVTPDTLDPRPDSETAVQAALGCVDDRGAPLRLLDLGTGTGCLLLALLSELPNASGVGTDRNPGAVEAARANAEALGLADRARFVLGNWGAEVSDNFHLIVTNPPYIPDTEICRLAPEVSQYEPRLALAGGPDGLDCYRTIAPDLRRLLAANGHVIVEVGAGQADAVQVIFEAEGLRQALRARDLGGIERCLVFLRE